MDEVSLVIQYRLGISNGQSIVRCLLSVRKLSCGLLDDFLQEIEMIQEAGVVGKNLPSVELYDLAGRKVKTGNWKGTWTILVFLRHLG